MLCRPLPCALSASDCPPPLVVPPFPQKRWRTKTFVLCVFPDREVGFLKLSQKVLPPEAILFSVRAVVQMTYTYICTYICGYIHMCTYSLYTLYNINIYIDTYMYVCVCVCVCHIQFVCVPLKCVLVVHTPSLLLDPAAMTSDSWSGLNFARFAFPSAFSVLVDGDASSLDFCLCGNSGDDFQGTELRSNADMRSKPPSFSVSHSFAFLVDAESPGSSPASPCPAPSVSRGKLEA